MRKESRGLRRLVLRAEKNFRLGIDLDGVVIDHATHFLSVCKKFGHRLELWQVNSNIFELYVPGKIGKIVKHIVYAKQRSSARIFQNSAEVIKNLKKHISIASVQKEAEAEKKLWPWLLRHGILRYIPKSRIHIFRSRMKKLARIKKLKPHFFIDDGLDVLENLPKGIVPILFDPAGIYMRLTSKKKIYVVKSWREIERIFT